MTSQSPGITCNIVSFKYFHLVAQAIESVLNQTVKPDIIRLIDDGVGDCQEVARLYPEVEYILRPENLGVVANFNLALLDTTTDKVMFLGADNWLNPRTIERLLKVEADIVTYDCYMVGDWDMDKMAQYEHDGYRVWKTNGTPHGSALYDVNLAREVGGYKASGNEHTEEDSMLFNKMVKAGATVGYVERPMLYYRHHKGNFNAH